MAAHPDDRDPANTTPEAGAHSSQYVGTLFMRLPNDACGTTTYDVNAAVSELDTYVERRTHESAFTVH